MRSQILRLVTILVAVLFSGSAFAGTVAPDDAKITDGALATALTETPGDAANGGKVFANRKLGNCLACHINADMPTEGFHGEIGPALDGVASRYSDAELRAIIVNSKAVFGEDTLMPGFYRTSGLNRVAGKFADKPILSGQQVEDVLAYLLTLKDE